MWFFLSLLLICFTIIALFRMYLDLREHQNRHNRLVQSDVRSYDKYKAITQQEALQQLTSVVEQINRQQRALPAIDRTGREVPPALQARYYTDATSGITPNVVSQAEFDQQYLANDYNSFMDQQRRNYGRNQR